MPDEIKIKFEGLGNICKSVGKSIDRNKINTFLHDKTKGLYKDIDRSRLDNKDLNEEEKSNIEHDILKQEVNLLCKSMENIGLKNFGRLRNKFKEQPSSILSAIKEAMEAFVYSIQREPKEARENIVTYFKDRDFECSEGTLANLQIMLSEITQFNAPINQFIRESFEAMVRELITENYLADSGMYENDLMINRSMEIHNIFSLMNIVSNKYGVTSKSQEEDAYIHDFKEESGVSNHVKNFLSAKFNDPKTSQALIDHIATALLERIPPFNFNPSETEKKYGLDTTLSPKKRLENIKKTLLRESNSKIDPEIDYDPCAEDKSEFKDIKEEKEHKDDDGLLNKHKLEFEGIKEERGIKDSEIDRQLENNKIWEKEQKHFEKEANYYRNNELQQYFNGLKIPNQSMYNVAVLLMNYKNSYISLNEPLKSHIKEILRDLVIVSLYEVGHIPANYKEQVMKAQIRLCCESATEGYGRNPCIDEYTMNDLEKNCKKFKSDKEDISKFNNRIRNYVLKYAIEKRMALGLNDSETTTAIDFVFLKQYTNEIDSYRINIENNLLDSAFIEAIDKNIDLSKYNLDPNNPILYVLKHKHELGDNVVEHALKVAIEKDINVEKATGISDPAQYALKLLIYDYKSDFFSPTFKKQVIESLMNREAKLDKNSFFGTENLDDFILQHSIELREYLLQYILDNPSRTFYGKAPIKYVLELVKQRKCKKDFENRALESAIKHDVKLERYDPKIAALYARKYGIKICGKDAFKYAVDNNLVINGMPAAVFMLNNQLLTSEGINPVEYAIRNNLKIGAEHSIAYATKNKILIDNLDAMLWTMRHKITINGDHPGIFAIKNNIKIEGKEAIIWAMEHNKKIGMFKGSPISWAIKHNMQKEASLAISWAAKNKRTIARYLKMAINNNLKIEGKEAIIWAMEHNQKIGVFNKEDPIAWAIKHNMQKEASLAISWAAKNKRTIAKHLKEAIKNNIKIEGKEAIIWAIEHNQKISGSMFKKDPIEWAVENNIKIEGENAIIWAVKNNKRIDDITPMTWATMCDRLNDVRLAISWAAKNNIDISEDLESVIRIEGKEAIIWAMEHNQKIGMFKEDPITWAIKHNMQKEANLAISWAAKNKRDISKYLKNAIENNIEIEEKDATIWAIEHDQKIDGMDAAQYALKLLPYSPTKDEVKSESAVDSLSTHEKNQDLQEYCLQYILDNPHRTFGANPVLNVLDLVKQNRCDKKFEILALQSALKHGVKNGDILKNSSGSAITQLVQQMTRISNAITENDAQFLQDLIKKGVNLDKIDKDAYRNILLKPTKGPKGKELKEIVSKSKQSSQGYSF